MKQFLHLRKQFTLRSSLRLTASLFILLITLCASAQSKLVGLTSNGGPAGKGTVFSLATDGTGFSVMKGFADWGINPTGSLVKGTDGNFYGMTSRGGTFTYGAIFRMTPAGAVTILKQFNSTTDGAYPYGELILGTDGNFYGMANSGGTGYYGTIFSLTPGGVFTVLKNFSYSDGAYPRGHLTLATDGSFYGITYGGGSNGTGVIFKMTASGTYTVLHNMVDAEGSNSYGSLVQGTDGNLYGTTYSGGANRYGTLFKVTLAGTLTVLRSLAATTDGSYPQSTLIQAKDGYLYGTTTSGSGNGNYNGTLFKMKTDGSAFTVVHNFVSATGTNPIAGLMENSDGLLYGITTSGGSKSGGVIYSLSAGGAYTVVHPLDYTTEANGSSSVLVRNDDGSLYAMAKAGGTYGNGTVFKVTTGGALTVLNSFNGATEGNTPYGAAAKGSDSAYYVTTSSGGASNYGTIVKICGGASSVLYSFTSASGRYPKSRLLLAGDGNFYGTTSEGGPNSYGTIFKITPGGVLTVLHSFSSSTDGGNPLGGLIQGTDGFLYGTCSTGGAGSNGTIFKMDLSGTYTVLKSFVYATDGGAPYGELVQANDGNLYGVTSNNGHIFKITTAGVYTILHAFAGSSEGYVPYSGLMQAGDGNLYGTTSDGGANSGGTIYQVTLAGAYKVVHAFYPATEGKDARASLLQGADGLLYGTTSRGGANGSGTIFKMSAAGDLTVLRQMNLLTDGGTSYSGLTFAPVNNLVANAQSASLNEDSKLKLKLTGSGGSPLAYTVVSNPAHGKLTGAAATPTYTPAANYNGADQFSFTVSVGCLTSAPAIVSLTVNPVADAPILAPISNKSVVKNNTLTFQATATDADKGQTLTYSLAGAPAGAAINATTGMFSWTPAAAGTYTFKVRVTDNDTPALYDEEQITVTVTNTTLTAFAGADDKASVIPASASVYPNPAEDVLNVTLPLPADKVTLQVTDLKGTVLITQTFTQPSLSRAALDISRLGRGFYLLKLQTSRGEETLKFIKK